MSKFRKRPVVIDAVRWWKNGDHPEDFHEQRPFMEAGTLCMKPGSFFKERDWEGSIVRYFRRPDVPGEKLCDHCTMPMNEHGWIDTLEGGHVVYPGDWIITGVKGERYPCKPESSPPPMNQSRNRPTKPTGARKTRIGDV